MWRKSAVAVVVFVATVFVAGSAFALHVETGKVIAVNPSAKTLTIENAQGEQMTCRVMEKAAKSLANLKPGDEVGVNFTIGDGNRPVCHLVFGWPVGG